MNKLVLPLQHYFFNHISVFNNLLMKVDYTRYSTTACDTTNITSGDARQ